MYNETIIFYSKTPPNKGKLGVFDVEHWEDNRMCGDDLKVYIAIKGNKITDWSFEGDTAIITTACASIFGESILGEPIQKVFEMNYDTIIELIQTPISRRRRQASVLGLLTTRNALHKYLNDGITDNFDDLIG